MEQENFLSIRDLYVTYHSGRDEYHAANGITLSMRKGETLGLVGETGAGKTTTALALMRLLPRTAEIRGEITCGDLDVLKLEDKQLRQLRGEKMTMIFQDPMTALDPVVPVGKQIEEAIRYHNHGNLSREQIWQRVDEVLELVGIPKERHREYPHQFSGGMKQRVVIAIALACEPELLIADEPTTALDVTIQAQILSLIADLRQRLGMSVIMITHDLGIVAETCDTVGVIYAGHVVEYGTVEQIFSDGAHHPYTQALFNAIPSLDRKVRRLSPVEGLMPDPANLPEGCCFSPRCPYCREICKKTAPEESVMDGHRICCHLFAEAKE